jgi:hypothetical protein
VPVHPVHPDHEQLAAWQAGELGGRDSARIEAHVAGCPDCARVVAVVERGRSALDGLAEADLPAGFHERLVVAVERERAALAGQRAGGAEGLAAPPETAGNGKRDGGRHGAAVAEPIPLDAGRERRAARAGSGRRGRRRVALLSTAAAVVLLVAGLFPLVRYITGGNSTGSQTASRPAAATQAPGAGRILAEGGIPVPSFSAPDGYSGAALQSALQSDPDARAAYQRAASGSAAQRSPGAAGRSAQPTEVAPLESKAPDGSTSDSAGVKSVLQQGTCLAAARNKAGDQSLRPAFFVTTVYQGRAATVLVTVHAGAANQVDLWAFPRDNCSAPPFAHERVTVQAP